MTTIDPVQLHELQGASELRAATDREQDPVKRNALLHEQWKNHLESDIIAELQGKDPVSNLTPAARVTSPEVHEKFVVPRLGQRFGELKRLKERPEIRGAIDLYNEHIEQFKKLNAVPLAKLGPYATPDDIALAQLQMKKLEIPEESRQSILFGLGEMNRLGREIEPTYDIRNDPDFKHIIDGIGVDAGPGYFTEGTVEEDFGTPLGRIGYEGARAFDEGLANAGNALMDVGLSVMAAINPSRDNQELLNQFRAEAYGEAFVDRQGNFVSRAPRAQSATGLAYLATRMGTMKTVDDIRQRMERVAEAETIMRAHERGWLEEAATATTIGLGSLASFVATGGGRLMGGGVQLVERGKLGAALLLGAKDGTRLHKAAKLLRTGLGMGIGNGIYHATLYGRPEGYAKAFIHSLPMGLVFAAAGAAGKATEKLLAQRTSMPKFVRRGIAGAVEGLALTPGSALEMQSALWEFMRDANPETSNRLMKEVLANTLSFGLWKAMTGSTPAESRSFFSGVPQPGRGIDWIRQRAQQFQARRQQREQQQQRRSQRARERIAKAMEPPKVPGDFIGPRQPDVMADRPSLEAEARWRVVDFDKLTEAEQRKVDAERRQGKPKSFNQRMKVLSELQDPMERTDFLELPEAVRARILKAPHELARKAIWFEHISTSVKRGGGDRRQGERRQGGKEVRPSVYPRPHVAAELRRTAKMDRSTARLAELIPDEPRLLQPGEIRALQDLIQEHVARLQGIEIGRGTVPYGKTKAEAIRENTRRTRLLNEAFRVLRDMRPQEVERVPHEEPIRFDSETGKLLNKVIGAGTTRKLAGPHIAREREAILDRVREKIEYFARKARATELNEGRGSYRLSIIRAKLKRLRGVETQLRALGERAVIAEAQLEGEPGLEGVPRIGGRLRVEELIEQVQEAGEMRRMLEAAGAAPRETTAEHHPNGNPYPNQTTRYHEARHRISQGNGTEHDIEFVRLADKATAQMRADNEAPTANANRLSLMQAKLAEQIEAKGKTEPRAEAETEPQREAETEAEMLVRVARETEIPQGSAAELDVMAAEAELALNAVQALGFRVGEVPGPRAGQPASLRLLPQLRPVPPEGEEPTPTRARDVIAALEGRTQDPVQIRIRGDVRREGEKIPGGVLGWFARGENQIRLRTPRAILAATHESAHAMDNRLQARGAWRDGGTTDIPDVLYEQLAQAAWTYPGIPQAFATSKMIETALRSGVHPKHGTPLQPSDKHSLGIQLRKIKDFVQAEGFAEFWARWRLEDPVLKQETPILWDFMLNELMERPELAEFKAMNNYQRQVLANFRDQGAEMRVQMARVMETDEPTEVEQQFRPSGLGEATQSFKKSMLDDLADAKVAWEKWKKASEMGVKNPLRIPISMDPIRLTEALRMTAYSQADRAVNTGTFDIFGNRTGEPLEQVFRDLIEGAPKELRGEIVRLFLNYATAKRSVALEEFPRRKAREKAIREALLEGASKEEAEAAGEQAALRAKVPDTGIHRADADFVIGKYERSPLRELFDEALKRIREWSLNILDYGVESGYLRPSDVEAMALAYDVYLPFHRAIESSEGAVVERLLGRGVSEHPAGLKSFEGTDIEIRDPLVGLRAMAYDIIQRSQRYMVMQSLYLQSRVLNPRLVANRQAALGSFVTQVARDAEPRRVLIDQIAKQLRKAGEALAVIEKDPTIIDRAEQIADDLIALFGDAGGALTFFFPMERPTGSRPRIAFRPNVHHRFLEEMDLTPAERQMIEKERGRTLWFELDETLFNALMTIDAPRPLIDNMPRLVEAILIGPARLVAGGATVYNPYFVARNIARDTMSATVYKRGKEGYTLMGAIADAYRAAKAQRAAGKGTENFYSRYANLGLEGASIYGAHFARQARGSGASLTAEFHRGATQFLRFFQRGLNKWGRKLAKPESWHRSIEFRDVEDKELREGAPRMDAQLEAMLAAKEVSGNFTRAGNIARAVNQLVPYYAPNLAGKRKMLRVMSGREGKDAQRAFWARAAVNVTAMTLAVAAWNLMWEDDAEWREDLPEWKRLNYWNIRMPGGNSIPLAKPFELGQVFATIPEAILDAARLAHGDEFFGTAVKNLTEEFTASVTNAWKVAAVVPFIETIANHSFFKDRQLVPAWMQKSRLPEDQFTRYSTGLAKTLGKVFGMSPILIDNLLAGYTGGLGLSLARGADQLVDGIRRGDFGAILGAPFSGLHPSHPHELGAYADAIYDWSEWMTQAAGSDSLDRRLERLRPKVERVKAQIAEIRRSGLSQAEADQRVFEIAKPVVDQLGSMHP